MKRYSEFSLGDMLLTYYLDEKNCMSMTLIPADLAVQAQEKEYHPEPLVQIHARGDLGDGRTEICFPGTGRESDYHNGRGRGRADCASPGALGGRPAGGDCFLHV